MCTVWLIHRRGDSSCELGTSAWCATKSQGRTAMIQRQTTPFWFRAAVWSSDRDDRVVAKHVTGVITSGNEYFVSIHNSKRCSARGRGTLGPTALRCEVAVVVWKP
jgi:hypothetical protein